jgi:hypothetical protein
MYHIHTKQQEQIALYTSTFGIYGWEKEEKRLWIQQWQEFLKLDLAQTYINSNCT